MSENTARYPSQYGYPYPPDEDFSKYAKRFATPYFERFELQPDITHTIVFLNAHIVYPDGTLDYRIHRHRRYEMIIPFHRYHCSLNSQELSLEEGQVLVIQPGDVHLDHLAQDEPYYSFEFSSMQRDLRMQVPRVFVRGITPLEQVADIPSNEELPHALELFWHEVESHGGGRYPVLRSMFHTIFWKCLQNYDSGVVDLFVERGQEVEILQQRILALFQKNLSMMPDIDFFCEELGMSHSTLARVSHLLFKMPLGRAFMNYKINTAKQRLAANPDLQIKEISAELGFFDQFHFSKTFKRILGVSPTEYLRQIRL